MKKSKKTLLLLNQFLLQLPVEIFNPVAGHCQSDPSPIVDSGERLALNRNVRKTRLKKKKLSRTQFSYRTGIADISF